MYYIVKGKRLLAVALCCVILVTAVIVAANLLGEDAVPTSNANTNWDSASDNWAGRRKAMLRPIF